MNIKMEHINLNVEYSPTELDVPEMWRECRECERKNCFGLEEFNERERSEGKMKYRRQAWRGVAASWKQH